MKRRIISTIIVVSLILSFLPAYAADTTSGINYPSEGAELGYLFSLKSEPAASFDVNGYKGIEVVSEMANIYFSDTIEHIKAVEDIVDIDIVVENWSLSTIEPQIYNNTSVSLFSDETIISPINTDELYLNDPFYEQMWHYDAVKAYAFRDNDIDGRGVKVGIIDSGLTNEFKDFCDFEGVDICVGINICAKLDKKDELLYDTKDNQAHGTSVASIICAKANNNYGIAGLMDGCTVIPYKVEDYRCSVFANSGYALITAIDMAYNDGCDVLNISRGTDGELPQAQIDMENKIVNKAIQNGMIIMAACGNSGDEDNHIEYPAACDNVIGVGATRPDCDREEICIDAITGLLKPESEATINDKFANRYIRNTVKGLNENDYVKVDFSTANASVFICAPGINIPAVDCRTIAKIPFTSFLGTSAATPIVSSAAIGVKQMRPYVDTDMFKEILKTTAVDLEDEGYDINTGYGMVNFERIYNYVSQMPMTAPERVTDVSIDYENERLIGFPLNRDYTVNGENVTVSEDGTLQISEEWFGTTIEIVKKASSEAYTDSEPQELVIPARPESPKVELLEDKYIKGIGSDIWYKEENEADWKRGYDVEDYTITLQPGIYTFMVKDTDKSFASKPVVVVVDYSVPSEYDIETDIEYNETTGMCSYSVKNNTGDDINAAGIVAVYDKSGILQHMEMINIFPSENITKELDYSLQAGNTVKFIVWDSLQSMKPKDKVKLSKYTVLFE
jgi:subtilisin family serine protease